MAARFPLFKGATRVPTVGGVPLIPLVALVVGVASTAVLASVWWLGLLLPGWLLMAQVTKADDRAFRVLWLWARTKLANRLRLALAGAGGEFWSASSYALSDGRTRSWEGKESRWAG